MKRRRALRSKILITGFRHETSGADMRVLFALRRAGKPYAWRPTDLFRAHLVTSGAITKQVGRLTSLGFVERTDETGYAGAGS